MALGRAPALGAMRVASASSRVEDAAAQLLLQGARQPEPRRHAAESRDVPSSASASRTLVVGADVWWAAPSMGRSCRTLESLPTETSCKPSWRQTRCHHRFCCSRTKAANRPGNRERGRCEWKQLVRRASLSSLGNAAESVGGVFRGGDSHPAPEHGGGFAVRPSGRGRVRSKIRVVLAPSGPRTCCRGSGGGMESSGDARRVDGPREVRAAAGDRADDARLPTGTWPSLWGTLRTLRWRRCLAVSTETPWSTTPVSPRSRWRRLTSDTELCCRRRSTTKRNWEEGRRTGKGLGKDGK